MKFAVKFNTRKLNKEFGNFAADVREMCESDRRLDSCHPTAVAMLKERNLATVSAKGPGWPLAVTVDLDGMVAAGFVASWDVC